MKQVKARVALALAAALVVGSGLTSLQAQAEAPASVPGTTDSSTGGNTAGPGAAPSVFRSMTIKGGYTAAGVSLRNRGKGNIKITGIPAGAKVQAAYLLWSTLGGATPASNLKKGKFRGKSITGALVGSGDSPCWPTAQQGYSYRANVTKWVKTKKNATYALSGFASGVRDASDPFNTTAVPPLAEGASLVVVYSKSSYPTTRIVLANGYGMVSGGSVGPASMSMTLPFGFAATTPVGEVTTTFIGGDGQLAEEPASTVNGVPVAGVDWDGNDGPNPKYSQGNLWDTQTAALVDVVKPGQTSANITVNGGPDCLVWTGQAFSIGRYGYADTDGDKLLDGWEANGYDSNNNNVADVPLPGASVVQKDLYVEMDWMGPANDGPSHLAQTADLNRITNVFATAPYAKNPNGRTGIRLHLDAGTARGDAYNLGGGNQVPFDDDLNPAEAQFDAIRAANFNAARAKIYYYMIWGHGYGGGTSSGNAFAIPSDKFLVTLGKWNAEFGTPDQKVGTFIHEFGHALGQKHGGDDHGNYEPNYLSVMNYAFQTDGVQRTGTRPPYFGYSSRDLPDLKESRLNERSGLRTSAAKTYETRYFCNSSLFQSGRADRNIDWNCNGRLSTSVSADINGDGQLSTLKSYNNWAHIVYGGGAVGGGASTFSTKSSKPVMQELTLEESQRLTR